MSMTRAIEPARRLVRPPALRTGESATASRLELFFDLAYVLVVMQLADGFLTDLDWSGVATFSALFVALWVSWVRFTLYANRFDTDDTVFRVAKLTATLAVAGCAASASGATTSFSTPFAACFLLGRVVLLLLDVRAWYHVPQARRTVSVYLGTTALSAALWAASLGVGGTARWALWAAAVVVDAAGPLLATRRGDNVPLHMEHLPERFALLVILVLGEAVGGAAVGVHDAKWAPPAVAVGVVGFLVAAALWWNYFDVTAAATEPTLREDDESPGAQADDRHDLFVYGHLPLTLGIVMAGVGIEELVLHPGGPLPPAGGWVLVGGVALYVAGSALILGGTRRSWRAAWPWPAAALPLLAPVAFAGRDSALLLTGGVAAVCVALAVTGTLRRVIAGAP